jgi:hypothetical protein
MELMSRLKARAKADDQFVVQVQEIRLRVAMNVAAQCGDGLLGAQHDPGMQPPQLAVDFQILQVALGPEPDQFVDPTESAKTFGKRGGTGQVGRLINHDGGKRALVLIEPTQALKQFFVSVLGGPGGEDLLNGKEVFRRHNAFEGAFLAHPHVWRVLDVQFLELEGTPVVEVVANVFFVGQYLMHDVVGPALIEIGAHAHAVEASGDFGDGEVFIDQPAVHQIDVADFVLRARAEDDPVGLQALLLATAQRGLEVAGLIDQHPAQAIARVPSLTESHFDQAALADKDLGREFATVFSGHGAFDALDDSGHRGAVVLELLGDIRDEDVLLLEAVFPIRGLVRVLETSPATDVID